MRLFPSQPLHFDLPEADVTYFPNCFDPKQADTLFSELLRDVPWQQDHIKVYGKTHAQPRLTALFGNDGKPYSYSNLTMQPHPWTVLLQKIKCQVEETCQSNFTTVLLNLYRDGNDGNGWHADNEKELGTNPVIASLSLGAERVFQLRHNSDKSLKQSIVLEHGSLLLMKVRRSIFGNTRFRKRQNQLALESI